MFVFGGNTCRESFNDLWQYSLEERSWARVKTRGSSPSARVGHALVPFGRRLILFGGRQYMDNSFDAAMHCFDLRTQKWTRLTVGGESPRLRTGHSAVACSGAMLVFGGLGNSGEYFNDAFVLRLFD
eukprot:CAMPEP_0185207994 /NCGR_PEP_ID=MMETSP1140-20130426/61272_1 /TAXON_ID=298111 /ORGANISM="Pavlova sp., Strain CCMP459" /LENGTH=126 /DNA_ID=CAMNT_0027775703 /DNA_START=12 /DNA_END=392 /DNA_ORIENTATION=+